MAGFPSSVGCVACGAGRWLAHDACHGLALGLPQNSQRDFAIVLWRESGFQGL
jgi:hypothetical protein